MGSGLGMPQDTSEIEISEDAAHAQGPMFDYNMADISSSFGPYFDTKGNEDMMALLGVGAADSGSSQTPDAGTEPTPESHLVEVDVNCHVRPFRALSISYSWLISPQLYSDFV